MKLMEASTPIEASATTADLTPFDIFDIRSLFPEITYRTGETREEVLEQLLANGLHIYATGSRVTSNFNPKESDYDYVVLDTENWYWHDTYTSKDQWQQGESGNQYSEFQSLKKQMKGSSQVVNLIFVRTKEMFTRYVMATDLIRKVNPETKEERITFFDMIFKNSEAPF
jgi:hypothetical protein